MKISPNQVVNFVKKPSGTVLLYGPDQGLATSYAKDITNNFLSENERANVIDYDFADIKSEVSKITNELNSISMFGKKVLIIRNLPNSLPKLFEDIFEIESDNMMILLGGDLPTSSSFRKFFDKSQICRIIACYKDDPAQIRQITISKLLEQGYKIENEAVTYLTNNLVGDRLMLYSELDKLTLYMGNNKNISLDDVEELNKDNSESSIEKFVNSFASLNPAELDKNFYRLYEEGVHVVMIIRSLINYFLKIYQVNANINSGLDPQSAISSLRPPIFFKQLPIFKSHLQIWNLAKTTRIIEILNELETQCKFAHDLDDVILLQNLNDVIIKSKRL